MKITVINKSNGKVKTMAGCPWILDEPPVAGERPAHAGWSHVESLELDGWAADVHERA